MNAAEQLAIISINFFLEVSGADGGTGGGVEAKHTRMFSPYFEEGAHMEPSEHCCDKGV